MGIGFIQYKLPHSILCRTIFPFSSSVFLMLKTAMPIQEFSASQAN